MAVGALFGGISADRSPSWPHSSSFLTRGNASPFDGRSGSAPNDGGDDGGHRVSSEVSTLNFIEMKEPEERVPCGTRDEARETDGGEAHAGKG